MATAEGVKNKISGLIANANGKTGKTDSTLTAAVDRLIAGYGQGSGSGITPTGTITLTKNGNYDVTSYANANVTIPEVAQAVPEATVNDNGVIYISVTQEEGYVLRGTRFASINLPTQAGKTVTPGATEQIAVPKGVFTTGEIKVAAMPEVETEAGVEAGALSEIHYWEKYVSGSDRIVENAVTDETLSYGSKLGTGNPLDSVDYSDSISVVDGALTLASPVTKIALANDTRSQIVGKYIYAYHNSKYYRIPSDAIVSYHTSTYTDYVQVDKAYRLTAETGGSLLGIVVSADSAAYPQDGEQDGYRYVYMGTLNDTGGGGVDTSDATAKLGDVLSGKTFYAGGSKRTGVMPNNGAVNGAVDGFSTTRVNIPAGYTSGGFVSFDSTTLDGHVQTQGNLIQQIKTALAGKAAGSSGGGLVMKSGSVTLDADAASFEINTGLSSVNTLMVRGLNSTDVSNTHLWVKSDLFTGDVHTSTGAVAISFYSEWSSCVSINDGVATCKQSGATYPIIAGAYDWVAFGTV